ncbi:fatty acid-binding protein, heart-like [Varroa jacobsoni]|uniref:Fatty acid-binding protein n=1 Tax=Varroa destructor TaxID=109461 RepID=A0A7M7K4S9_VARDE|nr:fatty acid-binding protein, heart-like [Varroa destructor]XP_022711541.1 fatty acid-binding protein, heart-like [Varroa jacobsoni]
MVDALIGTWKLETSENFEELLKELGVNMVLRKAATATKPNAEISKNGDEWTIRSVSTLKTTEIKFKIGEEFEETRADNSKGKSTFIIDGDKLKQVSEKDGKQYSTVREIVGGKLKVTVTIGNIVCTRVYSKV